MDELFARVDEGGKDITERLLAHSAVAVVRSVSQGQFGFKPNLAAMASPFLMRRFFFRHGQPLADGTLPQVRLTRNSNPHVDY